jgi:hypothetical protein
MEIINLLGVHMQNMQDRANLSRILTIRAVEMESFNPEKKRKTILPIIERRNRIPY